MQRLFRSVPDNVVDAPIGDNGAKVELSVLGKSRKALLVWAKQNGLHLDHEAVSELFPNITAQQELLDAWLVETSDGMFVPSLTPIQRETEKLSDKIIEAVGKFGVVVGDINQIGADRVCVCLKQNHGSIDGLKIFIRDVELLKRWFRHQGNTLRSQQAIGELVNKDRLHLFVEYLSQNSEILPLPRSILQLNEKRLAVAEHDSTEALKVTDVILSTDREGKRQTAEDLHSGIIGMMRYIYQILDENPALRTRIHGLRYPERKNYINAYNEADKTDCKRIAELDRGDAEQMNRYLTQQVSIFLGSGECGIILLGGLHFRSGMALPPEVNGVLADSYWFDDQLKVETCIEKNDSLRNVRFIIVEPNGYR